MKINTVLSQDAEYIGDVQENRVGIDKSNLDFITTLLTSNLYSEPLASFLRETVANAYDSHVEAGTDEHILLLIEDIPNKYKTYRISIRDYGTGVSPERFEKIYRNIGSSTKRESNDYIGMFGIGRFSCLSCADVAHITSYYEGKKYSYVMYKNGGGINIDMVSTSEGEYKDGLEVSVEIQLYYTSKLEEAIEGLCLFDKVYAAYKGEEYHIKALVSKFNSRQITHYKNFSKCTLLGSFDNYFRVGNVLYPGKMDNLSTVDGLIVELPIGSVDITPNREALQYTSYTNATIEKQVAAVKQELQDIVNEQITNLSLAQFCESFAFNDEYQIRDESNNVILSIRESDVELDFSKCTIDGEPLPSNYLEFIVELKYLGIPKDLIYKLIHNDNRSRFIYDATFRNFLCHKIDLAEKKDKVTKQVTLQYTIDNLSTPTVVLCWDGIDMLKSEIKRFIKQNSLIDTPANIDECIDFTFKHAPIKAVSNDAVPSNYIESFKNNQKDKRKKKDTSKTPIRVYSAEGYRISALNYLPSKGLIVYTNNTAGDNSLLRELADLLQYSHGVAAVITLRESDVWLLEANKRGVTVENFLYIRNKVLSKFVTGYTIYTNFMNASIPGESSSYYNIRKLPLWNEFYTKYHTEYEMMVRSNLDSETVQNIIKYYLQKGWVNQADIDYFTLSKEEVEALTDWENLKVHKNDIIRAMALKKHGRLPKIGLTPIIRTKL